MSGRRDTGTTPIAHEPGAATSVRDRHTGVRRGFTAPVSTDVLTVVSVPTLLLVVHFLIRPHVEGWYRFGYVRYAVARTAPAHRVAPDAFAAHISLWHELTRLTHALVHDPSNHHAHLLGNVVLIGCAAWALLVLLDRLGRRQWFVFVYWELVMVGPIVGSYSFDLFGTTPRGYGASTIGYAFLGALVLLGVGSLLDSTLDSPSGRHDRGAVSLIRSYRDRDSTRGRAFVCVSLLIAVLLVTIDFVEGSPAMAVHQAGVGFGALAGATVSLIRTESVDVLTRNTRRWREGSATSDSAPFDDGSD